MKRLIDYLKYNRWITAWLVRILKTRLLLANDNDIIIYRQLDEWQSYEAPQDCHLYGSAPHVKYDS